MYNRVKQLRKQLKLSQSALAKEIGVKQNTVSFMENPNGKVTEQNIITICSKFNVSEEWLRTGKGQMFLDVDFLKKKEFFEIFDNLTPELKDYLLSTGKELLTTQEKLLGVKTKESE